jgi:ABC-type transporter MlaC component
VLTVNQNGENPRQLYKNDSSMVWISNVQNSKDIYVAMFNIGNEKHPVNVDFSKLDIRGKVTVRDLWKKSDIGTFQKKYRQMINAHGCALLRLIVK